MRFFSCLLVLIGACGDDTSSSLGEDVVEADLQMPDDASEDSRAGDAGGDRCPTHIEMYNVANPSHSDLGWTGFGHGLGSNDGSLTTLEVTGCDSECRRCSFSGPVRSPVAINNQRCLGDTRIECTTDDECGEDGRCRFLQGPPLALNVFGQPSCITLYYEPVEGDDAVRGTIDLETGATRFDFLHQIAANNNPDGVVRGACSQCLGDPSPGDGVAGGTCSNASGGLMTDTSAMGEACDANGFGASEPGTYSYDCPATVAADSTDFNLGEHSTAGARWVMDETRPPCTNPMVPAGLNCWCGVCEDEETPCASDADCASGSCGYWDPEGSQVPTAPNGCASDSPCMWDPVTSRGACTSAAAPATVGCLPPAPNGTVLEVSGGAVRRGDEYFITMPHLQCLGPAPSPVINRNFGYPGPALHSIQYRMVPRVFE